MTVAVAWSKLDPFTVSVKPAPPTSALRGLRVVTVGTMSTTLKATAAPGPPPGVGLVTPTRSERGVANCACGIVTSIVVGVTELGVYVVPSNWTVAPLTKLVPFSCSCRSVDPFATEVGVRDTTLGSGLVRVSVAGLLVPPPPLPRGSAL